MEVFHYLAEELKGQPIFDNVTEKDSEHGAVYNDFDGSPLKLLLSHEECAEFSLSQPHNKNTSPVKNPEAIEKALDSVVMEADKSEGLLYEHLVWESSLFDNYSEECDVAYMEKVYKLVTNSEGCWSEITISPQAEKMFERRARTGWSSPDSVFDTWILLRGWERPWFDNHQFEQNYPDYRDAIESTSQSPPSKRNKTVVEDSGSYNELSNSNEEEMRNNDLTNLFRPTKNSTPKSSDVEEHNSDRSDASGTEDSQSQTEEEEQEEEQEEQEEQEQEQEEQEQEEQEQEEQEQEEQEQEEQEQEPTEETDDDESFPPQAQREPVGTSNSTSESEDSKAVSFVVRSKSLKRKRLSIFSWSED